jgi:hypothetical protein
MAAAAAIVLADHVPTNHTFNPIETGKTSLFETREMAIPAAEKQLILQLSRASSARHTDRITERLNIPFMQTVDGVNSVRSTARVETTIVIPDDCSSDERALVQRLYENMAVNPVVRLYVTTREQVW